VHWRIARAKSVVGTMHDALEDDVIFEYLWHVAETRKMYRTIVGTRVVDPSVRITTCPKLVRRSRGHAVKRVQRYYIVCGYNHLSVLELDRVTMIRQPGTQIK
jgi:hypothetical protein